MREKLWLLEEPRATEFCSVGGRHLVISFAPAPTIDMSTFTKGERHICTLLAAGFSNAEIARARGTSLRTVANQVGAMLRKTRADSRHQLALRVLTEVPR